MRAIRRIAYLQCDGRIAYLRCDGQLSRVCMKSPSLLLSSIQHDGASYGCVHALHALHTHAVIPWNHVLQAENI